MNESFVLKKIEKGRQVAGGCWSEIEGVKYYESAGIQKYGESYRVGIFKIPEQSMMVDDPEIEEVKEFSTLLEAREYVKNNSSISFESMKPQKGQKAFNLDILRSERNLK